MASQCITSGVKVHENGYACATHLERKLGSPFLGPHSALSLFDFLRMQLRYSPTQYYDKQAMYPHLLDSPLPLLSSSLPSSLTLLLPPRLHLRLQHPSRTTWLPTRSRRLLSISRRRRSVPLLRRRARSVGGGRSAGGGLERGGDARWWALLGLGVVARVEGWVRGGGESRAGQSLTLTQVGERRSAASGEIL